MRSTSLSRALLAAAATALVVGVVAGAAPGTDRPPKTKTDDVKDAYGSVQVADPYRWLEDQKAPETRAWIDEQNKYSESFLHSYPGRNALKQRVTELLKIDTIGVPSEHGGRYFFTRRLADQDLPVVFVRNGAAGKDEVLIDPHPLSADHTTSVDLLGVIADGTLAAYGVRLGGEDEVTVHFLDVDSRKELPEVLPRARYQGVRVRNDRSGVFFSRQEKEGPRVYWHAFGTDFSKDVKIFGDGYGPEKGLGVGLSEDNHWLTLTVSHGSAATKTEIYVRDLSTEPKGAGSAPLQIVPIVNDVEARFSAEVAGDTMYLETAWDAPNGRVFAVDLKNPARDKWKEVIPAGKSAIQSVSTIGGRLFVRYLEDVQSRIRIFDPQGKPMGEISFPQIGSAGAPRGRWTRNEAFYTFTSFVTPMTIYRYDVAKGTREVWAQETVPFDGDRYEIKQVKYASKDGTQIPMFLAHRKGIQLDGSNPALLTGYGGFNLSQTPNFSAQAALWVESGGVYALPNLRGGGEFGEEWHRAGMLAKKQNVFDDFVGAAEWLIKNGYTSASKLAITGGSNGGLLVGAALTQRPDLFAAVVCSYPLLDMVRYHKFLVAGYWVPEYGSADKPDQFPFLYAYSPYHHVKAGTKYPAVLFITGDSDTRVAPLHARKMTALLQASTGSDKPVILHYDTKAGHSRAATPITKRIDELTDEFSFLFVETGARMAVKKAA
ncbi:MAG TPA: prolyl oligopeptidase family serine peptidase [Thermoanaerobaculia bacterium]|nr:prolyl oligopeptidase family serine peptidase [Thermoanaerobaculia bacterium]